MLLIGDGALPRSVEVALVRAGASVRWLRRPNDREIASVLTGDFDVTMVASRDDIEVLRIALVVEHARPGRRLIVTVFNRTVASQLRKAVPSCQVTSMADAVASTLAGPCIAEGLESLAQLPSGLAGVREAGDWRRGCAAADRAPGTAGASVPRDPRRDAGEAHRRLDPGTPRGAAWRDRAAAVQRNQRGSRDSPLAAGLS